MVTFIACEGLVRVLFHKLCALRGLVFIIILITKYRDRTPTFDMTFDDQPNLTFTIVLKLLDQTWVTSLYCVCNYGNKVLRSPFLFENNSSHGPLSE